MESQKKKVKKKVFVAINPWVCKTKEGYLHWLDAQLSLQRAQIKTEYVKM